MASLSMGMSPDEVEAMARSLVSVADRLKLMTDELGRAVLSAAWAGSDADRFRNEWWPSHRGHLTDAATKLAGLGQSALNNASEQREASGGMRPGDSRSSGATPVAGVAIAGAALGAASSAAMAGGSAVNSSAAGARSGILPNSHRSAAEVQGAFDPYFATLQAKDGVTPDNKYQCVSWAIYRWRELGYTGPIAHGDGGVLAGNNGGTTTTPPTLGAMASYGGHVMIVEEITDGGNRIRFSEMNTDWNASVATASEYSDARWMVRQADGTWADAAGGRNRGPVTFASIPT